MPQPTSTQVGAIAENLVANALMLESGGRLSPFAPQADDDGIDLLIYDKVSGRALPAQVKSRTVALRRPGQEARGNVIHFEIRSATYRVDRFAIAILVLTGGNGYTVDCAWVIPMRDLPAIARITPTKYVIRASKSHLSKDKFSTYRCHSMTALHEKVMEQMESTPSPQIRSDA